MRVTCVLFISGILLTGADAVRSVKQLQPAIERNDYGKGSKTEVLDVKVGDTKKKIRTDIEVSERQYTTEEIQELFGRTIRRMDRLILNENQTPDHVETDLNLITEIPGEPVTVSWELDRYDVMNTGSGIKSLISGAGREKVHPLSGSRSGMFREQRRDPCVGRGEKTEDVTCGRKQGSGNRTGTVYPGYPQDKEINGE